MKPNRDPIMHFNNIIYPHVSADLSRPLLMLQINNNIRSAVGADLSRPSPIYRPSWMFRYPDYFMKLHNQPHRREWRLCPK
jgi:hypothetical protein